VPTTIQFVVEEVVLILAVKVSMMTSMRRLEFPLAERALPSCRKLHFPNALPPAMSFRRHVMNRVCNRELQATDRSSPGTLLTPRVQGWFGPCFEALLELLFSSILLKNDTYECEGQFRSSLFNFASPFLLLIDSNDA